MKNRRWIYFFLLSSVVLSGCAPFNRDGSILDTATLSNDEDLLLDTDGSTGAHIDTFAHTPSPTKTITPTATLTSTSTPIPTRRLPVSVYTPIPDSGAPISAETAAKIVEVARYFTECPYLAKLVGGNQFVIVRDQLGVALYGRGDDEPVAEIVLFPSPFDDEDLQVSKDGYRALADRRYLLHIDLEEGHISVVDLREELPLTWPSVAYITLSPAG
jgi:hypothetical protein